MSALTVKEIKSLFFAVYKVTMSASNIRKLDYLACIMSDIEKDIRKYKILLPRTSQDAENSNTTKTPV